VASDKYDDMADVQRIINMPDEAFHRNVDKIVLGSNASPGVKTVIVGPPTIYGPGRGPVNKRSQQVYNMAKWTLERGFAPVVGTGKTEWDNVHVVDVSGLLVLLVDALLDPKRSDDSELFGPQAYFFCENGVHVWGEVARWIAEEAARLGYMEKPEVRVVDPTEIQDRSWGHNSKSVATRARKLLGWKPVGSPLRDEIPAIVEGEATRLGLKKVRE
jgi:nucleoside-diphosphate-sugar epimerase